MVESRDDSFRSSRSLAHAPARSSRPCPAWADDDRHHGTRAVGRGAPVLRRRCRSASNSGKCGDYAGKGLRRSIVD